MSTAPHVTPMVFRVDNDGVVFALMPTLPTDVPAYYCSCYQHVGQHSSADYQGCIRKSRPATHAEYVGLYDELLRCGYKIKVIARATPKHHAMRRATADRIQKAGAKIVQPTPKEHDAEVFNHGSLCVLQAHTAEAREWIMENIPADAMRWGGGIVIEPRYVDDIVEGMRGDGLVIA